MEHESLLVSAAHTVDHLLIETAAESGVHHGLGLSTGKQRNTVWARHDPNGRGDRTNVHGTATVNALVARHHAFANNLGPEVVEDPLRSLLEFAKTVAAVFVRFERIHLDRRLAVFLNVLGDDFSLDRLHGLRTRKLFTDLIGVRQAGFALAANLGPQFRIVLGLWGCDLLSADFALQIFDHVDNGQQRLMTKLECCEHLGLGHLLRSALDHHDRTAMTRHDELDVTLLELFGGGVDQQLAFDASDPHRGNWPQEGNFRNGQCGGSADECADVDRAVRVGREHGGSHHRVVVEAVRKQRADRAIDEARVQHFAVREAAFAPEETTGDLARGGKFLDHVYREREKVDPRSRGSVYSRDEHDRVTLGNHDRTGRLLGDAPGFDGQGTTTEVHGHARLFKPIWHLNGSPRGHNRGVRM